MNGTFASNGSMLLHQEHRHGPWRIVAAIPTPGTPAAAGLAGRLASLLNDAGLSLEEVRALGRALIACAPMSG